MLHNHKPNVHILAIVIAVVTLTLSGFAWSDILYIGQGYAPPNHIWRCDTDVPSTPLEVLSNEEPGMMKDIHLDPAGNRMYWTVSGTTSNSPGWVRSANLDGSDLTTVRSGAATGNTHGIAVDTVGGHIFYGSTIPYGNTQAHKGLVKMNLDGSDPQPFIATSATPQCVEIDQTNGKIYWVENTQAIRRANLDGSQIEDALSVSSYITDMELDLDRGLVYWSQGTEIFCSPLDGSSSPEQIIGNIRASSLALSPDGGRLYYGDTTYETVYQVNTDGSGHQLTVYANNPFALEVIPEPATLTLIALGTMLLTHRKRGNIGIVGA